MSYATESKRGSDCSGTDGATSRVLTLSNTATTLTEDFQVFVNGLLLVLTTEYTVSHLTTNSAITFLNYVWNENYIVVHYIQGSTGEGYCTYTDVYNKTGLSTTEISSAITTSLIADATSEVETLTGRKFTNGSGKTEYFSGAKKDIIGISGEKSHTINLVEYPIQSITEFKTLNTDGTANITYDALTAANISAGTYYTDDYWLDTIEDPITHNLVPYGKLTLKTDEFPTGENNIKVSYTYGYSTIPNLVKNLSVCLSGMRAWIYFLGGSYNYLNSYNIPQQAVNKGDFYQRGTQNIQLLQEEANRLLDRIGRRLRTLFYGSSANR